MLVDNCIAGVIGVIGIDDAVEQIDPKLRRHIDRCV